MNSALYDLSLTWTCAEGAGLHCTSHCAALEECTLFTLWHLSLTWACVDGAGLHCTSRLPALEECTLCTVWPFSYLGLCRWGWTITVPVTVYLLKSVLHVLCDLSLTWACADGAGLHCTSRCPGLEENSCDGVAPVCNHGSWPAHTVLSPLFLLVTCGSSAKYHVLKRACSSYFYEVPTTGTIQRSKIIKTVPFEQFGSL